MAKSITKPIPFSRAMPGKYQHGNKVKAHITKVGEITWAWNRLQAAFAWIFIGFVSTKENQVGRVIWNAIASDKAQRDILLALCKDKLNKAQYAEICWAVDQANKLSSYRNAFIHSPMLQNINDGELSPNRISTPEKYAQKIEDFYKMGNYRDLRGDILQLEQFVMEIYLHWSGAKISLREKPISRVLQPLPLAKKNKGRRGAKKAPASRA